METNRKSSDQELIRSYLEGNDLSFEIILTRYKDRIFSYLMSLVKNRKIAEDIFQDAFFKIIRTLKKGSYNEEGKFLPWAMRIAHNLAIDHFRKIKKMPTVSQNPSKNDDDDFDIFSILNMQESSIEDDMIEEQIHKDVRNIIDYLPEEQREIIILRHFKEMSFKDIAEKKDISINTALGRMRYALINLRKIIENNKVNLTVY
ncbi:MAG: sigma-70 family RNA polymerase sigma factor [Flavobacteriales bacterium]|jgi:RNA polymerase sigma-70 factor (ECF subfamily)|nr:sigma-70 family RNA polymerase sigma factor [Flavobacteriales bacterium]|tara:strand:+ start:610 stop:1218 length:609 start_codon:yes stop_codon:yes gene_type:complete